ncbi:hypothetical protein BTO30_15470 [Domibacillus antri]|uniref:WG repeat-containing protein n=1 Tax=Domibacillus antri TaxID=1714264 RepID=A0A1Q8Q1Z8_9BACI|nr:WG repeat-containing protein [Domibacillus antri]OLN21359.1 hypothetical protein BTO30_15470 [Domibacillus antri]
MRKLLIVLGIGLFISGCSSNGNSTEVKTQEIEERTVAETPNAIDEVNVQEENGYKVVAKIDENLELTPNGDTFSEDLLVVRDANDLEKYGVVNKNGEMVIAPQFSYISSFNEGLAVAQQAGSDTYGFIDKTGEWVIEPQFSSASQFSEGLAFVQYQGENYIYIDKNGDRMIELNYESISMQVGANSIGFSEGLAPAHPENGTRLMGFIDKKGNWVIEPKFLFVSKFSEGLALAEDSESSLFGFIDQTGEWVIQPQYNQSQIDSFTLGVGYSKFSEGLALLEGDNEKFGYIDKTGNWVIEQKFDSPHHFSGGLAMVTYDPDDDASKNGFIDQTGNMFVQTYGNFNSFHDGFATTYMEGELNIISVQK